MKTLFTAVVAVVLFVAGCGHATGQLPTTPSFSCTASSTPGTYNALTATTYSGGLTATTFTDTTSPGKTLCYFVHALDNLGGISAPSNTVLLTVPSGTHGTLLTWTAPAQLCNGGCRYVVFSLPANPTTPGAPLVQAPTTVAVKSVEPLLHPEKVPQNLVASLK